MPRQRVSYAPLPHLLLGVAYMRRSERAARALLLFLLSGCDGPLQTPGRENDYRECHAAGLDGGIAAMTARGCSTQFDRGAASAALGSIGPTVCTGVEGPLGRYHVKTTFAPDGTVKEVVFDEKGYHAGTGAPETVSTAVAATPRGECVLGKFRELRIPPFSGGPVSVGKMLSLQ